MSTWKEFCAGFPSEVLSLVEAGAPFGRPDIQRLFCMVRYYCNAILNVIQYYRAAIYGIEQQHKIQSTSMLHTLFNNNLVWYML